MASDEFWEDTFSVAIVAIVAVAWGYFCIPCIFQLIVALIVASPIPRWLYPYTPDEFRRHPSDTYNPEIHYPIYMIYFNYSVNLYLFSRFWTRIKPKLSKWIPTSCCTTIRTSWRRLNSFTSPPSYELAPTTTHEMPNSSTYEHSPYREETIVNFDEAFLSDDEEGIMRNDDGYNSDESKVHLLQRQ